MSLELHLLDSRKEFSLAHSTTSLPHVLSEIKKQGLVGLYMHMRKVQDAYNAFQSVGLVYDYKLVAHFLSRGVDDRINQVCKWIERYNDQGILYPEYDLTGTETGRITSKGFPFANLDKNPDIREIFKAREERVYLYLDYSQAEVIIAAYLFNSEKFLSLLNTESDIYLFFSNLWGMNNREVAKQCLILSIYGGGTKAFARIAKCNEQEAFLAQSLLFYEFPDIRDWIGHVRYMGSHNPFVTNAFGRRRATENLKPAALINFPVQSALADIKMCVIRRLYEIDLIKYLRLDFHDGLVFEIPNNSEIYKQLVFEMENPRHNDYFKENSLKQLKSLKCTRQISKDLNFK